MSRIIKAAQLAAVVVVGLFCADVLAHPLGGRPKPRKEDHAH